jgi:hypothetical protein
MTDGTEDRSGRNATEASDSRGEQAEHVGSGSRSETSEAQSEQRPREVVVLWGRCGFVPTELTRENPGR